jgi:hypothetical protein
MYVAPEHEKEAFTCLYCQVYTTQDWQDLSASSPPFGSPISRSRCFHWGKFAHWHEKQMLVPANVNVPMPSSDLPEELQKIYLEARQIFTASLRGAAALLRLVLQMLMQELGEPGKNLDTDIGSLAKKGKIGTRTTKMFHSIRITGNESVHPGMINLNEDMELANALFYLINLIVFDMTSYDKYVDAIWEKMPEGKRKVAEERDMSNAPEPESLDIQTFGCQNVW